MLAAHVSTDAFVGLWRSTAAITSAVAKFKLVSNFNLNAGTVLTLYGIASA
jgi:hypothetical protein